MRRVRTAVIGCGKAGQAQIHWLSRHADCEVVGIYDPNPDTVETCIQTYQTPAFSAWQEVATHPDVDLITLCGPESVRAQQAMYACQQGKHVLCEKPFANTLVECDQMIAAAQRQQVMLMAFYNMRFHPVVNAVDAILESLGPLYAARFSYTQFRTNVSWRNRLTQGGGVLKSQGVHAIDLALRWLGPVKTVSGEMAIIHPEREVEDFALINLRFENGAVGEIYTAYTDRQPEAMFADLQGVRGKLSFILSPYNPTANQVQLTLAGKTQTIPLRDPDILDPIYPGLMDCSKRALDHIVAHVRDQQATPLDGQAGRRSIEIVLAGYESQRCQTKVSLPLQSFDPRSLADSFPYFDAQDYVLAD